MEKPTIFFSHSSVDKDYVSFLNDKISTTTSRTVDLFQSSDGQSIPFGNNWVHKIEENLDKAKVCSFSYLPPLYLPVGYILSLDSHTLAELKWFQLGLRVLTLVV